MHLMELEKEKLKAQQMMRDMEAAEVAKEEARKAEKAKREERIAKIMNRMGDVIKKSDEAEKAHDR